MDRKHVRNFGIAFGREVRFHGLEVDVVEPVRGGDDEALSLRLQHGRHAIAVNTIGDDERQTLAWNERAHHRFDGGGA